MQLPDSCIMDYYEKYKHRMNELEAFNMVKVTVLILLPCIYMYASLEQSAVKFYVGVDCLTLWYAISKTKQFPLPYFGAYPIPELY